MRNKKIIYIVLFLLWTVLSIRLIFFRYPTYDEIHAWNIAANVPFYHLVDIIKSEGHFPLWYLLLKGCMALHLPYPQTLFGLNWLFMAGAIGLILFKSPLPRIFKVSAVFSFPLAVFYPAWGRPYGMTFFFLVLIAVFYRSRLQKPRLFALLLLVCSQTHLFGIMGAIGFGCLFAWDMMVAWQRKQVSGTMFRQSMEICLITALLLVKEGSGTLVPAYNVSLGWKGLFSFSLAAYIKGALYVAWILLLYRSKRAVIYGCIVFPLALVLHLFFYSFVAPWYFPFFACFIILETWIFYADRTDWATYAWMPWQKGKNATSNRSGWLNQLLYLPCLIFWAICWWDCKFMNVMPVVQPQGADNMTFVKEHVDLLRGTQVFVLYRGVETVPTLQAEGITPYSLATGLEFYSVKNLHSLYAYPLYQVPVDYKAVVSRTGKGVTRRLVAPIDWQHALHYVGDSPFTFRFQTLVCESDALNLCIFDVRTDPADV